MSDRSSRISWIAVGFALVILVCFAPAGRAGEIRFGGVLPGGGVINKPVVSLREARYEGLVPQETDFSCGAASVATILKYAYGKPTTEFEVLKAMLAVSDEETVLRKGFSLLDIKRYVESIGMNAVGFRIAPENLDKIKIPSIVLVDIRGYRHFVVLKKSTNGKVYVADPALGNKVLRREDFVAAWNGVVLAIVAEGYQADTALAQAQDPVSAKRLFGSRAPIVNADTFDFGTLHSDLHRF